MSLRVRQRFTKATMSITKKCTGCYIATDILVILSSKTHVILCSKYAISQFEILFQFHCDS